MDLGVSVPRLIAAVGTVSYNGVSFPSALHAKIQSKIIYQTGEVAVKFVEHSLSIDTILTYADLPGNALVTADANVGSNFTSYRQLLAASGKTLTFTEQGFGEVVINNLPGVALPAGARSYHDVAFGPKPRLLLWESLSNRAVHVAWTCDFAISECISTSRTGNEGLLEITHETNWTKNEEGKVTRTIRATIEIAGNVLNQGNTFKHTADSYVDRFKPAVIQGFHREVTRQISRDHRILNITYTDTEIFSPNPFTVGMVDMRARHSISSDLNTHGFSRWSQTLSGSVRYAAGVPTVIAWAAIVDLIKKRFDSGDILAPLAVDEKTGKPVPFAKILTAISIDEELYDREISFSIEWLSVINFANIISTSGLFKPLANLSWAAWHKSIVPAQSPQGSLGLAEQVSDLSVTRYCDPIPARTPSDNTKNPSYVTGQPWLNFGCSSIPKNASWLWPGNYKITPITYGSLMPAFTVNGPASTVHTSPVPFHTPGSVGLQGSAAASSPSLSDATNYQSRTYPAYQIRVTAQIIRVCYEPYKPIFSHYGDAPLQLYQDSDTIQKVNGQFFPTYYQTIDRIYSLPYMPAGSPILVLKTDANNK